MPAPDTATLAAASDRLDDALLTIACPVRPDLRLADYAAAMRQIACEAMPIGERAALTWRWRQAHDAALRRQRSN